MQVSYTKRSFIIPRKIGSPTKFERPMRQDGRSTPARGRWTCPDATGIWFQKMKAVFSVMSWRTATWTHSPGGKGRLTDSRCLASGKVLSPRHTSYVMPLANDRMTLSAAAHDAAASQWPPKSRIRSQLSAAASPLHVFSASGRTVTAVVYLRSRFTQRRIERPFFCTLFSLPSSLGNTCSRCFCISCFAHL